MEGWATLTVFICTLAISIVAWTVRVEFKLATLKQQSDSSERASDVRFKATEELARGTAEIVRSQSNQLIELRTDVKYIREGIDALRNSRG